MNYQTYPSILESYQASELAQELSISEAEAAAEWFRNVAEYCLFENVAKLPLYHRFIARIEYINADLYYDYGADYYFIAREINDSQEVAA